MRSFCEIEEELYTRINIKHALSCLHNQMNERTMRHSLTFYLLLVFSLRKKELEKNMKFHFQEVLLQVLEVSFYYIFKVQDVDDNIQQHFALKMTKTQKHFKNIKSVISSSVHTYTFNVI